MPPFPMPPSHQWSPPESPSSTSTSSGNPIASLFKSFGRNVSRATSSTIDPGSPSTRDRRNSVESRETGSSGASVRPSRQNMAVGSSSRGAGVRPKRSKTDSIPIPSPENDGGRDGVVATGLGGYSLAGPSRGGFVTQTRGKTAATVAASYEGYTASRSRNTSPGPSSSRGAGQFHVPPASTLPSQRATSNASPRVSSDSASREEEAILPPSKILPRLYDTAMNSPDRSKIIPLIRMLARSVALYPFPPPALAAASLSDALASHPTSPTEEFTRTLAERPRAKPTPTPVQIYLSQSRHLSRDSPPELRAVTLELMLACLEASLGATGGIQEGGKAVYWDEARRWSEEAKVEVEDGQGGTRWLLPDADREALVAILSALTRGGRDLSDVPGLVSLLCTFVTDSIPVPGPPSPLYDPEVQTHFIRSNPPRPSAHTSSLALLTSLHKFSAPHIYTSSTLLALRAALEVARLREERDLGGQTETGVLAFLGAVVRFGEVTGDKSARHKALLATSATRHIPVDSTGANPNEGDEILREVVSVVARIIGCEGLVGVIELDPDETEPSAFASPTHMSLLPPLALELMRDLIRSPANQALKSLRNTLIAPPPSTPSPRPPTPILLLVGALRALRKAYIEHATEVESSSNSSEAVGSVSGESRWPSLLSLGLPWVWSGLLRVMQWQSGRVDAEVLRLVEERLDAAERSARSREGPAGERDGEDRAEGGVSYEEWDMAIEILAKTKWHVGAWETSKGKAWILEAEEPRAGDDEADSEDEGPHTFIRRPDVLTAYGSLLRKVVRAWQKPNFTGPTDCLFSLLLGLAPHLSDAYAEIVLERVETNGLCLPTQPEWLDRTQEIAKAFYVLPSAAHSTKSIQRAASPFIRRRALQMLTSLLSHLKHVKTHRNTLLKSAILPLLETTLEVETDVEVADVMMNLVHGICRDAFDSTADDDEDGPLGAFDRLRLLLLRTAKGSVRPFDRYSSSVPTTPRRRPVALSSLSRYSSPANLRSSPSISAPVAAQPTAGSHEPTDVSFSAVVGLITLFHLCLAQATDAASEKAVLVFRDLLSLLSPSTSPNADITTESAVTIRTRLVILQWMVRLRADAEHRIYWIKACDVTVPANILGRNVTAADEAAEALTAVGNRTSEDGNRPDMRETRGRTIRQAGPGERSTSGSRLRIKSEERSPSRAGSRRVASGTAPSPMLWTVPESLPFDFGDVFRSTGIKGLASFDHNRMRAWTEEEDPGTGTLKVQEAPDTAPLEDPLVVLPVSEYLAAVNHILQHDQEWELVSYLLCHLPPQLCNKHFACGPRAAQQIHVLRRILCESLRATERSDRVFPRTLPPGIKRAEIHAVAYQTLTDLIPYRSLFSKSQQDEMVDTFMCGLSNPRDTAKPSIHALRLAAYELRPSVTKHLAEIVRHLQKIISSAELGVHILEFMGGVGQEPALYANFTEVDFQTVFGIAHKYIQAHNERLADNPIKDEEQDGIEYSFSQYVLMMAYYNIAAWFLALRLADRPKYVPFLTRRLVQANEGKAKIDEATEVCFDMIARYTYTNADPRPRSSPFDQILTVGRNSATPSKTWILGDSTVTIRSLKAPAWVEVTIRRPSGVSRMLVELQNIAGVTNASEVNMSAMYLRHRKTSQVDIPTAISAALNSLPDASSQPHLGRRSRSASFSGRSTPIKGPDQIEANTVADSINSAAAVANQPTLESGVLSVDPSFFALQMSSYPEFGSRGPPILVPNDPAFQRGITALDRMPVVDFHKIGILYVGPGQCTEREILGNTHGSKAYTDFISSIGKLVRLKGSRDLEIYAGGLDQESDLDGKWTYIFDDDIDQLVFHVATMMPTSLETDPQCTLKKRHIGNDYVKIIFNESGSEFAFDTLPGDFNVVNLIITPHTPAGNPWVGPGMSNNGEYFAVSMQRKPGLPEIGPLGLFKMCTAGSLPHLLRLLALQADTFAQIYLACVGFEAQRGSGLTKVEYVSSWRRRLQQIRSLRQRIQESRGESPIVDASSKPVDLDAAELARLFTSWL